MLCVEQLVEIQCNQALNTFRVQTTIHDKSFMYDCKHYFKHGVTLLQNNLIFYRHCDIQEVLNRLKLEGFWSLARLNVNECVRTCNEQDMFYIFHPKYIFFNPGSFRNTFIQKLFNFCFEQRGEILFIRNVIDQELDYFSQLKITRK